MELIDYEKDEKDEEEDIEEDEVDFNICPETGLHYLCCPCLDCQIGRDEAKADDWWREQYDN